MKNLSLIVLFLMFLASCQQSDELVTPSGSQRIDVRSQHSRPFQATVAGTLNPNSVPTACSGDLPLALLDYSLSGNATHLGKLNSQSFLHHVDCNLSLATMLLTTGVSGQLVAANGDRVNYSGQDVINVFNFVTGSGPNGPITGTWTITGGTGRFANATGSLTLSGIVDFQTLNFNAEVTGTITF